MDPKQNLEISMVVGETFDDFAAHSLCRFLILWLVSDQTKNGIRSVKRTQRGKKHDPHSLFQVWLQKSFWTWWDNQEVGTLIDLTNLTKAFKVCMILALWKTTHWNESFIDASFVWINERNAFEMVIKNGELK